MLGGTGSGDREPKAGTGCGRKSGGAKRKGKKKRRGKPTRAPEGGGGGAARLNAQARQRTPTHHRRRLDGTDPATTTPGDPTTTPTPTPTTTTPGPAPVPGGCTRTASRCACPCRCLRCLAQPALGWSRPSSPRPALPRPAPARLSAVRCWFRSGSARLGCLPLLLLLPASVATISPPPASAPAATGRAEAAESESAPAASASAGCKPPPAPWNLPPAAAASAAAVAATRRHLSPGPSGVPRRPRARAMSYPAPPDPAPPLGTPASDNPLAVPVPVPDAADASSQPPQPPLLPDAPPADPAAGVEFPLDADVDTLRNEIQEFYSYVEMPQVSQNEAAWRDWRTLHPPRPSPARGPDEIVSGALGLSIDDPPAAPHQAPPLPDLAWGSLPSSERRQVIEALLSALEVKETDVRMRSLRTLVYLLQGVFGETTGPDHQMYWMHQNARTVRQVGGLSEIVAATKTAGWKHNYLCSLPDTLVPTSSASGEPAEPLLTPQIKAEYLEDVNLELSLCFAALYHVLETGRVDDDDEWGDELMKLDPPLPIYLFNVVADLREKPAKGYPIKKVRIPLCSFRSFEPPLLTPASSSSSFCGSPFSSALEDLAMWNAVRD